MAMESCGLAGIFSLQLCLSTPIITRFTCPECVEGMEWVEAYMTDPLWVAEYTVYLEQNYCVGTHDPHCVDMVQRHFPPMHAMAMTLFVPQDVCNTYSGACGATKPPM